MKLLFLLISLSTLSEAALSPIEVVAERGHSQCEEFRVSRELRIYKDPSLFLSSLSLIYKDPSVGWDNLMRENPLLTTVRGSAQLIKLGPPREFKNFGFIARLYETVEPKLKLQEVLSENKTSEDRRERRETRDRRRVKKEKQYTGTEIVPVMLCGEGDAYRSSLGFVLVSDLKAAEADPNGNVSLPPSVHSIPEWKENRP